MLEILVRREARRGGDDRMWHRNQKELEAAMMVAEKSIAISMLTSAKGTLYSLVASRRRLMSVEAFFFGGPRHSMF
jgi:hypothetical protein